MQIMGESGMGELQLVIFNLNNQICGADAEQVQEIKKYQDVACIPQTPIFIEGIINLRGKKVPVINLNRRFGWGDAEITQRTKIIITSIYGSFVGFVVNDVSGVTKFFEEEIEATPQLICNSTNTYLKSIGKKGDRLISILDLGKLLTESEISLIKNMAK